MKRLINKILGLFGYQITKAPKKAKGQTFSQEELQAQYENRMAVFQSPLNADFHLTYAHDLVVNKKPFLAYAEFKTARFLKPNGQETDQLQAVFDEQLPDLKTLHHNLYFRLKTLSNAIYSLVPEGQGSNYSVLDVGGAQGNLAAFIPDMKYCLAEPLTNGIDGKELPFPDQSFDFVVSCHVLEHIPMEDRDVFLDQLLRKAKKAVILLNPIHNEELDADKRLRLIIEVTQANWAKEHLDCSLPKETWLRTYADKHQLKFTFTPVGGLHGSLALVFFDYLSRNMPIENVKAINRFFNEDLFHLNRDEEVPAMGLFVFEK